MAMLERFFIYVSLGMWISILHQVKLDLESQIRIGEQLYWKPQDGYTYGIENNRVGVMVRKGADGDTYATVTLENDNFTEWVVIGSTTWSENHAPKDVIIKQRFNLRQ
jgi:hypothetical protein